eukprot:gnl/TRDRNA2_/TRDRNA2_153354_c1_seq1.p1 gnl/TRDRNA2_/TRDRNA2_153354_c1~~gnl/TRDRNA2_/TRDRNA2_153354_c1_seq1.p1  ORF type:complete len:124 (+),score=22.77 gnl/TRDRNA2_/TRDRNA2_153354_c1_seq1:253-624(+)
MTIRNRNLVTYTEVKILQTSVACVVFLQLNLTPKGSWDSCKEVTSIVFDYLNNLRQNARNLLEALYPSKQRMSKVDFDFWESQKKIYEGAGICAAAENESLPEDLVAGNRLMKHLDHTLLESN